MRHIIQLVAAYLTCVWYHMGYDGHVCVYRIIPFVLQA